MALRVETWTMKTGEADNVAGFVQLNDDGSWSCSPENDRLFDPRMPTKTGDANGKAVDWTDGEVWIENLWKIGTGRAFTVTRAKEVES